MDKPYEMTQCSMVRRMKNGAEIEHVAWIPSGRAKVGNKVKIKDMEGVWEVRACYSKDMSDVLIENSTAYKRHRKATDI
jgi:hypothetical protein